MPLRCLLFSSDEETAEPIRQALAGLEVEGEYCSDATVSVDKITHQNFQIVIIDWDKQPEAGLLLASARERKAAERPLTLAIVSDDISVPKALQAGANSILRKPLLVNQVKDTLTTARDLLRAKLESAATLANAAAAGVSATSTAPQPAGAAPAEKSSARAEASAESSAESSRALPKQFVTTSHAPEFVSLIESVDSPRVPRPVATSVEEEKPAASSPPQPDGPRGLQWYLKTRAGASSAPPESAEPSAARAKPELLGYDQTPAISSQAQPKSGELAPANVAEPKPNQNRLQEQKRQETKQETKNDQKNEADLFAYMEGESEKGPQPKSRLGKPAIMIALALAGCAILAAPQAPWHSQMRALWSRTQQTMRNFLNPQPVTPVQAPVAHEDFGRAGDEYKMPASENIPDATTDPSQIQVVPVVDPTAKKQSSEGQNPEQPTSQPNGPGSTPNSSTPIRDKTPEPVPADPFVTASTPAAASTITPTAGTPDAKPAMFPTNSPATSVPSLPMPSAPPRNPTAHSASSPTNVPSSLKSQLASMTPDASGTKSPDAAMQSIEPVIVSETAERALLTDQPAPDYPANAKGQQGTVILQVLISREGEVQDAKFLQGSLAFARSAIDGARQWKFKPYNMNGRPVSVQTTLTISFKPQP